MPASIFEARCQKTEINIVFFVLIFRLIVPVALEPKSMPSSVTSAQWYRPNMTRDAAIEFLKDKPPGSFIVRDSTSYPGGYGLAMKVPDRGEHKTPEECVGFSHNLLNSLGKFILPEQVVEGQSTIIRVLLFRFDIS